MLTQAFRSVARTGPSAARNSLRSNLGASSQIRNYRHWWTCTPDDFGLPHHTMPADMKEIMAKPDLRKLDYIDNYWYWRVRKESSVLNPERMVKTSYKQLAYDMGMPVVNKAMEHQMGLIELYEYLKGAAFIGPWGSVENPVLIPAVTDVRQVACSGGTGDDEHKNLYFNCREGFLYRCGECDQVFMLVRITYANAWNEDFIHTDEIYAKDPDVDDVFDINLLSGANEMWNKNGSLRWSTGLHALNLVRKPIDRLDYFPTPEEEDQMEKVEAWYKTKFAAKGITEPTNKDRAELLASIKTWSEAEQLEWAKLHGLDKQLKGESLTENRGAMSFIAQLADKTALPKTEAPKKVEAPKK